MNKNGESQIYQYFENNHPIKRKKLNNIKCTKHLFWKYSLRKFRNIEDL